MKSKLLGLIACMALISVSQVSAATLVGTTTDAMGIDGLVVDGVTYDVTFVNASYNTVFASTPPTFLNNYTGAVDAASALTTALNSLGVTTMHGVTQSADQFAEIPYSCCNGLSQRFPHRTAGSHGLFRWLGGLHRSYRDQRHLYEFRMGRPGGVHACRNSSPRRAPSLRHRPRRLRSARLAQEAEGASGLKGQPSIRANDQIV